MAQQTDELKRDMEYRRSAIDDTVDQIQNRVTPKRVASRSRYRMRSRMSRWKDNVMGQLQEQGDGMRERTEEMTDSVREAPSAVERYTRGNPMAVGVMAIGAGALLASMLPETRQERRMARKLQPQMEKAASGVGDVGRDMADDVKETAHEGLSRVQETAKSAGREVKEEAQGASERVGGS